MKYYELSSDGFYWLLFIINQFYSNDDCIDWYLLDGRTFYLQFLMNVNNVNNEAVENKILSDDFGVSGAAVFYVENTTSTVQINIYASFTLTAVIFIMYHFQYDRMMSNNLTKTNRT